MVEKYRGVFPPGSIWFHLDKSEICALINSNSEIKAQLPEGVAIADLENADIQAIPGKIEKIESLLKESGLKIVTLFD